MLRVREITEIDYAGPVYDLDVNGDDLFAAPFVLIHNCDPPYPHDSRGDPNAYAYEMTDQQHRELAEVLRNVKDKVALSGYDCDLMEELYGDWQRVESEERIVHSVKTPRREVLWVNYGLKGIGRRQNQNRRRAEAIQQSFLSLRLATETVMAQAEEE